MKNSDTYEMKKWNTGAFRVCKRHHIETTAVNMTAFVFYLPLLFKLSDLRSTGRCLLPLSLSRMTHEMPFLWTGAVGLRQ